MVLIVSIKPEANLNNKQPNPFDFDDNKIYSKIFDLTIHLKPIHYDDYDSVLIELLKSNPEAKSQLEELIDCPKITNSCSDTNIDLIKDEELKEKIRVSLWESNPYHKMVFTKAWNRKFAVKKPS